MGIVVKSVNKNGNKIVDYTCERDGQELKLSRDELIDKINNKEVDNARIQVYKDQIIIRIANGTSGKTPRQSNKGTRDETKTETSADVMNRVANGFNIKHIPEYSNYFFQTNPTVKDKVYTVDNISEKASDMREMIRYCRLVALKQINDTYENWNKTLDDIEYMEYCKENNIEE